MLAVAPAVVRRILDATSLNSKATTAWFCRQSLSTECTPVIFGRIPVPPNPGSM
jgi:hypothetical protein